MLDVQKHYNFACSTLLSFNFNHMFACGRYFIQLQKIGYPQLPFEEALFFNNLKCCDYD